MSGVQGPVCVGEEVEDAKQGDEEHGAPLSLEANDDHDASAEADDRNENSGKRPFALHDEADKEEDEQHAAGELEADCQLN